MPYNVVARPPGYRTGLFFPFAGAVGNVLPQQGAIVARYRTDQLTTAADGTAVSDGKAVSSWPDMMGGVSLAQATAANQPIYKANRYGGKPTLLFNGTSQYVSGTNTAANSALTSGEISMMVVYGNVQTTSFGFIASLTNSTGFNVTNNSSTAGAALNPILDAAVGTGSTGFATGMFSLTQNYNGFSAARGPIFVNSQVIGTSVSTTYTPTSLGVGASATGIGFFKGEVLEIIIWNRRLTAYEAIQAEMAIRDYYTQPYPWASAPYLYMATGDSITYGYGLTIQAQKNWPRLVANGLGLPVGSWANHGYIGANPNTVNTIINGERLKDITTLTGKPVKFSYWEFYNQRSVTLTAAVANTQTVLNNIHSVSGNKVAFGTTVDYGNPPRGSEKLNWTQYWDTAANRTGYMDAYIPMHTDNSIGIDGACANSVPYGHTFGYYSSNGIQGGLTGCTGSGTNTLTVTGKTGASYPAVGTYIWGSGVPVDTYVTAVSGMTFTLNNTLGTIPSTLTCGTGDGVHLGDYGAAQMQTLWQSPIGSM